MNDPTSPKKTFITFDELSQKLGGRSESAIRRDLKAGRLPKPLVLGNVRYWDEVGLDEHLDAMMAAQRGG